MDRDYRYAPIPPLPIFHSRVSDNHHHNQDFYHQHPPPAPPLRHPPRIPFPTEEESTRTSVFNLDHLPPPPPLPPPPLPPRVSDHQPYIPSFYREENHNHHFPDVWGDRFQNLEQQPPRFHPPVDDDHLTRPSPYSMGGGWDHRDVVTPFNHTVSSYPSDVSSNEYLGFDQKRFGEDHLQEGRLFTGEYSRDDIGYHRNQNQDSSSYHLKHHVSSSSDIRPLTSGNMGSGYGFLRDDQDPSWMNNREETAFEEGYRKWNSSSSSRQPPAFHHSQMDIENEEEMGSSHWVKNKGERAFTTGKRFPHQSNKSTVGKEGSQEFVRTPKKKVQRTSALLRVQLENPTNKKLRDEKKPESNSVPSCGEPESVDLDVSFKSNALVAKAKTVPSSSMVGPNKCKPDIKKKQNSVPSSSSASHVTESHEGPKNGDNATQGAGAGATSRFFTGLTQSKDAGSRSFKGFKEFMDAVADSGVGKIDNIGTPRGLDEASRSFKGSAPSKYAGTDFGIVKVDNNSSQPLVFGKPQSKDAIMDVEKFIDDIISSQSHVIAKTQSKDKVAGAGTIALDHVGSLPCINEVEQSKNEVTDSGIVKVDCTDSTHGVGATSRSIKGSTQSKDAGLRSFKGFTQSSDEVIAAGVVKVDNLHSLVAAPRSFKGKTPSKDATTDAEIVAVSKNSSQPRVKRKRQSKDVTRDVGSIVADPFGSQPRVHGKTQSKDAVTNVGDVKVDTGSTPSVGAGSRSFKCLTQSKDADSRSFKGFKELMDSVTDSGVVKSDKIGSAPGLDATLSSFKGLTPSKEAGTDVGILEVGDSSSQSSVNRKTQSKDVIADVGSVVQDIIGSQAHLIGKTQSKDTALDVGIVTVDNLGSLPCVNETNVSLERGRVVGSFPRSLAGSDRNCAPKGKKKRNRKKKVSCPNLALSSQVTEVHEGTATADSIALGADATMSTDIRLTLLDAKVSDAGAAVKCAPKIKKKKRKRKVKVPTPCLSKWFNDVNEGSVNGDSTTLGADATASSNRGLVKSEAKATDPGAVAVKIIGLQPHLNGVNVSLKNVTIKKSPSSHMICSSGLSTAKVRKKRSLMLSSIGSSNSRVTEIHNGTINLDIPMDGVNAASTSEKGIMRVEEKIVLAGHGKMDDIGLQPLNCSTELLKNSAVVGLSPSHMMGAEDTPSTKKGRKLVNPLLGSTKSAVAELHESPLNAARATCGTAVGLSCPEKDPRHSEEKVADSSNEIMDYICDATLTDGVNVASTSLKDLTRSEENNAASGDRMMGDIGLEPLNCSSAVLNDSAVVGLSPSCMMGSEETPGTKKRRKLMNPLLSSRSMVTVCSTRDTDGTLSSQKGQTHSEEKLVVSGSGIVDNSQPVPAIISPFEDGAVAPSSLTVASDGAYTPKVKQPNSKSSANADTGNNCARSTSKSEKALMQPKEKAIVSTIVGVQSVGSQPSDVSTELLENRVEVGSAVVVEEDVRFYAHPNVYSDSLSEESTFPTVYSPPSGSKGSQHVVNPVVTLQSDFTELESGGQREGETQLDAAEHGLFSRLSGEDIGLHSQMQDKLNFPPLEVRNSVMDERVASKALEDDSADLFFKDELLSIPDNTFSKPEASDIYIVNPSVGMECVSDRATKIVSQPSLPMVPELPSLNSKPTHHYRPGKKGRDTNNKPDEKFIGTIGNTSSTLDPNFKVKSDQVNQDIPIVPEGTQSSASLGTRQQSSIRKPAGGVLVGKNTHGSSPRQMALPVRATLASSSLKVSSSSYIARPRTWNRTNNSSSSLPHQKQCVKSVSSDGQPEFGKLQSTSYIRKGNSLVRKCTPVATVSQGSHCVTNSGYQLSPLSRVESKKSVAYEKKVNNTKPLEGLSTGVERHKINPLAHSTKFLNSSIKSCQEFACTTTYADPLIEGSSEATNLTKLEEIRDAPKFTGASEDEASVNMAMESQGIPNDGKLKSPEKKRVIYVKRKSNQLVATRSTELCDSSANVAEKTQELPCSISFDKYYKRNKNQLIRNVPTVRSHLKHSDSVPGDNSNSKGQRPPKVGSLKCYRNLSRQRTDRNLFPWKRVTYWKHNLASISNKTSSSLISKKLLLSRKRDTVYTRSTGGFSLRKSRVLSIGGSNLKWSKSIENRSKKANEEATLAVAAVEKKKREQKTAAHAVASAKKRNQSSRERIFRIGSVRYRMDPSKRTLQRIPDEKSPGAVDPQSGKDTKKSFIPKRLLIGNDEYIRIGNGNQLVRDPKKRIRILASEKIRWSLHTARLRLARKQQYCQFFTRFGKCNKEGGKCPYIHDRAKIAVCTKFLKGLCSNTNCKLTHKVIPERMQDCSYFLQGLCSNENCPYRHVNVNPSASVCEGFLRGFCADGNECHKKHTYVCPVFQATGQCPQGSSCKLHHPRTRNKTQKRKRSKDTKKISNGRYFGSTRHIDETGIVASDKHMEQQNNEDIVFHDGKFADYISLDISDEEAEESNEMLDADTNVWNSDSSDIDELIKPVALMNKKPRLDNIFSWQLAKAVAGQN